MTTERPPRPDPISFDPEPERDTPKPAGDGGVKADSPGANPGVDTDKPGSADAASDLEAVDSGTVASWPRHFRAWWVECARAHPDRVPNHVDISGVEL